MTNLISSGLFRDLGTERMPFACGHRDHMPQRGEVWA